jgi:hypothetical protein
LPREYSSDNMIDPATDETAWEEMQ